MFTLTDQPLTEIAWIKNVQNMQAGAFVVFEGRVRSENNERKVMQLVYEGDAALAANEFARIEAESLQKFDILEVRCAHRTGTLALGDTAVWIGILAAHRGPAFEACRYVIDELKKRLPIWKKEFYTDGDSGWLEGG